MALTVAPAASAADETPGCVTLDEHQAFFNYSGGRDPVTSTKPWLDDYFGVNPTKTPNQRAVLLEETRTYGPLPRKPARKHYVRFDYPTCDPAHDDMWIIYQKGRDTDSGKREFARAYYGHTAVRAQ